MEQTLRLQAADGHGFNAYLASPAGVPRGALVIVQEIFGLNHHIRSVADRWAADGYLAIAPALFDRIGPDLELGYADADMARGRALRAQSGNEAALLDIAAARAHVGQLMPAAKVGVMGYCWGGLLAWLAACQQDGFAASVPYYGGGIPDHGELQPRCAVQCHFGERDHFIPVDKVRAFATRHPQVEVHLYAADHGFNCDERASYDAAAAALARSRAQAFLAQHLG